jgi:hypothetical protein
MKITRRTTIIREILREEDYITEDVIEVEAIYHPGCDATYYDPEEPPMVEIVSALIGDEETELADAEFREVEEDIFSQAEDRFYED